MVVIGMVGSSVFLILRFRRADSEERQQIKWLALAGAVAVVTIVFGFLAYDVVGQHVADGMMMLSIMGLPLSAGLAILRYRLYDIDLVINKTVVFAVLAGFITAVYAGVVVGLRSTAASRRQQPRSRDRGDRAWLPWHSSRSGSGCSTGRTASCTASVRRPTRPWRR